jgi:hypothetical protein
MLGSWEANSPKMLGWASSPKMLGGLGGKFPKLFGMIERKAVPKLA